jgi:hypothetical protein
MFAITWLGRRLAGMMLMLDWIDDYYRIHEGCQLCPQGRT